MRRITHHGFTVRVSLLTGFILVAAAVFPLVALAGQGNPGGI